MLKRTCPFGETTSNQLKTHVGQKEIAEGVDKEKHMKEVYDKTLAMMFESQRQPSDQNGIASCATPASGATPTDPITAGGCHDINSPPLQLLPGQMLLDEHGMIIEGKSVPPKPKEGPSPPRCCTCCKSEKPGLACCYTCDTILCPNCARQCLQCNNGFCIMCSVINYDENCDRIFCLGCSSRIK